MFQEIYYRLAELSRVQNSSILLAIVKSVDYENGRITVIVDELESGPIPVITRKSGSSFLPDEGEQGLVLCVDGNINNGVWVGTIPTVKESLHSKHDAIEYPDGTKIFYDRENHRLDVFVKNGEVNLVNEGGNVTIKAENVSIEASELNVRGDLKVKGDIESLGDVKASEVSLKAHSHKYIPAAQPAPQPTDTTKPLPAGIT